MVRRLIVRWSQELEVALRKVAEHTTDEDRLAGYGKSLRVEAKFILLALAPMLLLTTLNQIGWPAGMILHVGFWLCVTWSAIIIGIFFASYWRANWGSSSRKS